MELLPGILRYPSISSMEPDWKLIVRRLKDKDTTNAIAISLYLILSNRIEVRPAIDPRLWFNLT